MIGMTRQRQPMTIVVTLPCFISDESRRITDFLDSGKADLVHIRKPHAREADVRQLIKSIPPCFRSRLVLHDFFGLAEEMSLYGIHLNSRNPFPPPGWHGSVSRSCHSIDEVALYKPSCDYVSLSPIFDSISKAGYTSAFSIGELRTAVSSGIIDKKVMALGGITFTNMQDVLRLGFGGVMILGAAWQNM